MYIKFPADDRMDWISCDDLELEEDGGTCKIRFTFGGVDVELREVPVKQIDGLIEKLVSGVARLRTELGIAQALKENQQQSG